MSAQNSPETENTTTLRTWAENGGKGIAMGLPEAVLALLNEVDALRARLPLLEASARLLTHPPSFSHSYSETNGEHVRISIPREQYDRTVANLISDAVYTDAHPGEA